MFILEDDKLRLVCAHSQEEKSQYAEIPPSDVPYKPDSSSIESIVLFGWSKTFSNKLTVETLENGAHLIKGLSLSVSEEWTLELVGGE